MAVVTVYGGWVLEEGVPDVELWTAHMWLALVHWVSRQTSPERYS